jgi:hypothetical protein
MRIDRYPGFLQIEEFEKCEHVREIKLLSRDYGQLAATPQHGPGQDMLLTMSSTPALVYQKYKTFKIKPKNTKMKLGLRLLLLVIWLLRSSLGSFKSFVRILNFFARCAL